jgi:hypothetical protein
VEEPVHDDEQHNDGEEACGGLQVECGNVVGQCAHDADGDHPGDKSGKEGEPGAPGDRPAAGPAGAGHAGGDGGEDENALEAFAKDEDADVEHGNGGAGVGAGGIGRAAGRKPLPGHGQEHAERGEKEEYFVNRPKPNCRRTDGDGRRGRLNSGRNHPAILSQ